MKIFRSVIIVATIVSIHVAFGAPAVFAQNASSTEATSTPSGAPTVIDLNIPNPLAGTVDSLPQLFQQIVQIIISVGIPLIAIALVYSGFLFVSARGSDENIKHAKTVFTYAVIGGLILLASWLVAGAVKDALTSLAMNALSFV